MKYPQRNRFEMAAHEVQFEKKDNRPLLQQLQDALEDLQKPMFREDGKLNL